MENPSAVGKKSTFVITVHSQQHATWQGTIKWLEKQEELPFRSALELIKLIDSTLKE